MRVLIVYQLNNKNDRNTISEHLFSFRKYSQNINFHYLNVFGKIPSYIQLIKYDAVILHYTFLAGERFLHDDKLWQRKIKRLSKIGGYKIIIPQDEYDHTDRLRTLCKLIHVDEIYTCFTSSDDIEKAYPQKIIGNVKTYSVFTGYVDGNATKEIESKIRPFADRPIDIGYRARKLPAYFGKHGQLKYELVELFSNALSGSGFVYDISNTNQSFTNENPNLVKLGNKWYEFLLNCKTFIGCEGGSSLLDADGSIKEKVIEYSLQNPDATFEEIEKACFSGQDYNIRCFAISPRHFEAALCKTLQILVEGEYGGAFKPWDHYIPLKRDFSNINEVLEVIKDADRCQQIVDRAYTEVVLSNKFTYQNFVETIVKNISINAPTNTKTTFFFKYFEHYLKIRNEHYWRFEKLKYYLRYSFHFANYLMRSIITGKIFEILKMRIQKTKTNKF